MEGEETEIPGEISFLPKALLIYKLQQPFQHEILGLSSWESRLPKFVFIISEDSKFYYYTINTDYDKLRIVPIRNSTTF